MESVRHSVEPATVRVRMCKAQCAVGRLYFGSSQSCDSGKGADARPHGKHHFSCMLQHVHRGLQGHSHGPLPAVYLRAAMTSTAVQCQSAMSACEERLLDILWLLFTCWASTCAPQILRLVCRREKYRRARGWQTGYRYDVRRFTFVALWLALRFQMKISGSARERLLRPGPCVCLLFFGE